MQPNYKEVVTRVAGRASGLFYTSYNTNDPADIASIQIDSLDMDQIRAIKSLCKRIKRMSILKVLFDLQVEQKFSQLGQIETLEELMVGGALMRYFVAQITKFRKLKTLQLTVSLTPQQLAIIVSNIPNLQKFSFSKNNRQQREVLTSEHVTLLQHLVSLKSLEIMFINLFSRNAMKAISVNLQLLTSIAFKHCKFEDPQSLLQLQSLKDLEEVKFVSTDIRWDVLMALLPSLRKLQRIHLDNRKLSQQEALEFIQKAPRLKSLTLSNCNIGGKIIEAYGKQDEELLLNNWFHSARITIRHLMRIQKALINLDLSHNVGITDDSVLLISQNLKYLKQLLLQGCQLTQKGITYIRLMRKLTVLDIRSDKGFTPGCLYKLLVSLKRMANLKLSIQGPSTKQDIRLRHVKVNFGQVSRCWIKSSSDPR